MKVSLFVIPAVVSRPQRGTVPSYELKGVGRNPVALTSKSLDPGSARLQDGPPDVWRFRRGDVAGISLFILAGLLLFSLAPALASEAQLKEGNRLFWKGQYEEALKKYNDALIDTPESSVLQFNVGAAAYQMGDFGTAEKRFKDVGDRTPIPALRSGARYNQGNAHFRQNQWKEAIEAYKDALRSNPKDEDARYNLGVAMNALKNPPKQPPKSGSGKDKNQKNGQKSQEKKPGEMSKEDAERLLSAAGSGEQKKPKGKGAKAGIPHPEQDW